MITRPFVAPTRPAQARRIGTLDEVSIERLATSRNVWLATVRPDGRPHVAPVWFTYVEDRIWIGTGLASVRVRNLRRNPAASASLEDGDAPVVAEGTVALHREERPAPVVEAFQAKYGWDITVEVDEDIGAMTLLEFRPHRWLFGLSLPTVPPDR
jgi:PPOX class probable F420-dependent enzyme